MVPENFYTLLLSEKLENIRLAKELAIGLNRQDLVDECLIEERIHGNPYMCTKPYEKVSNPEAWKRCPNCEKIPRAWEFDNGRITGCGCGESDIDHFRIQAESIMSVVKRSENGGNTTEYDSDGLRKNWNHWVETGVELFPHQYKETGRW